MSAPSFRTRFRSRGGGGRPCNPGGVIAVHAQSSTLLHWLGLHCAERTPVHAVAVGISSDEQACTGVVPRRVDRSSRET